MRKIKRIFMILNFLIIIFQLMGSDYSKNANQAVGGFNRDGAFHFGSGKVESGKLRTENEAQLEFFILTNHWRIQKLSNNISWHSKKPIIEKLSAKQGTFSGIVGKTKYKCTWDQDKEKVDISYTADISASKKQYRAVNFAGISLSFNLNENVKIKTDKRLLDFKKMKVNKESYDKAPKSISVVFPNGITYSITNLKGFRTIAVTRKTTTAVVLLRVPNVDLLSNGCSFTLKCNKDINKIYPENFEYSHDQAGWKIIKPVFNMKFLDVSKVVLDAPAGKYGFLKVKKGKFYFEKSEKPVKFIGVQLVHGSKFPSKKEAVILAKRIAAMGANIVRFHHMDYFLKGLGLWDRAEFGKYTRKFDKELIDRMDYLIWQLKKNGVYTQLDGITSTKPVPGDNIPNGKKLTFGLKGVAYVLDQADIQRKQENYFKLLWNHYNPYTKLKYKDDPAIALTEIINESDLFTHGNIRHHFPEPYNDILRAMFKKWQINNNMEVHTLEKAPQNINIQFRIAVMRKYYNNMRTLLREIGVKIPVTGTNWLSHNIKIGAANAEMDYTADHPYAGDELFLQNPYGAKSFSGYLSMAKVINKPLVHNEWNVHNSKGINRVASILYHIALSSAMGHDGTILFALFHDSINYNGGHINSLNVGYDSGVCAAYPAAAIMFLRGDLESAQKQFVIKPTWQEMCDNSSFLNVAKKWESLPRAAFNESVAFDYSALFGKAEKPLYNYQKVSLNKAGHKLLRQNNYPVCNDKKQLFSYWKDGYFLLKSKKSKWAAGYLPGNKRINLGDGVNITLPEKQYACILLTSLDGNDIVKSKRVMITTVSYVEQPGLKFSRKWKKAINSQSKQVQITKPVKVKITINADNNKAVLQSIDPTGAVIENKKIISQDKKLNFSLTGKALVYQLKI